MTTVDEATGSQYATIRGVRMRGLGRKRMWETVKIHLDAEMRQVARRLGEYATTEGQQVRDVQEEVQEHEIAEAAPSGQA